MASNAVRVEEVAVPMADGAQLAADVIALDDGIARPTLLIRTPYSRAGVRQGDDVVGLARLGWSVVVQDVRGRFDSDGDFFPYQQEAADGAATIEWCARQPWSDGRVAGWGGSYVGATQLLAASARPPALRAIAPMVTSAWYDDGWTYEGGALQLGFTVPWAALMAASDPRATDEARAEATAMCLDWDAFYRHPLGDHPARAHFPALDGWLAKDPRPTWRPVAAAHRTLRTLDVPGFHIAGWYDLFCEGSLRTWQALSTPSDARPVRAPQRLVVGPWSHERLLLETFPEMSFGPAANGMGVRVEALDWLRRAVDGDEVAGGTRVFVMGAGQWRDDESWPPPSTPTSLWLDRWGTLRRDRPTGAGRDEYDHDPNDPVPTMGGRTLGPFLPMAGPVDQRPLEHRPDVLVYTSEPLAEPLTVIGPITATISFSTTGRSADVNVKVIDVHPDGRAFNVVDSVRRATFTPGRPKDVPVEVGSTAICFLPGHRIRVHVSSSNFPRLDRNPSDGVHAGDATTLHGARQTVHTGGSRPSSVTLPVVGR